ncbi:MAG: hypothetical protein JWP67_1062 [Mucilaginibacter sp.]|nr:hypothetical protein [Mucilaginibacter sp.]
MQTSSTINFILPFLKLDTIDDLFQWILGQYSAGYIKRAKAFYSALTLDEKNKAIDRYDVSLHYKVLDNGDEGEKDYFEFINFLNCY